MLNSDQHLGAGCMSSIRKSSLRAAFFLPRFAGMQCENGVHAQAPSGCVGVGARWRAIYGGLKMQLSIRAAAGLVVGCVAWTAVQAQERIYRCGNEYTNNAATAKQRNCQVVDGAHVTIVHRSPAPASAAATNSSNSASSSRPAGAVQVTSEQQKARDNDARAILQAELSKAQEKLDALRAEYNDGNPVKSALELRNPQVYGERLESLKANIARQESDVAGIQREIARLPGG